MKRVQNHPELKDAEKKTQDTRCHMAHTQRTTNWMPNRNSHVAVHTIARKKKGDIKVFASR